jgi:membrane protein DedA with SNARE-associated domain
MEQPIESLFRLLTSFWQALQSGQIPPLGFWVYPLIALLTAIEGPIVTLVGATAASSGLINPLFGFIAACTGNLVGDSFWYLLGYFGKYDWVLLRSRRLGIHLNQAERFTGHIQNQAVKLLFIAKVTNGFIVPALIAAGAVHLPWRRWFPWIALGEVLVTGTLIALVYYTAASLTQIEKGLQYFGLAFSLLFLLAAAIFVRHSLKKFTIEKL